MFYMTSTKQKKVRTVSAPFALNVVSAAAASIVAAAVAATIAAVVPVAATAEENDQQNDPDPTAATVVIVPAPHMSTSTDLIFKRGCPLNPILWRSLRIGACSHSNFP